MIKICIYCKEIKSLEEFHNSKQNKDGKKGGCKPCRIFQSKKWTEKNREKSNLYKAKWASNNPIKNIESKKSWKLKNKGLIRFYHSKRRANKHNATLKGFDDEIKEIYKNRPEGYHVDHIVPLQGETVCGLHVPWNLQYLTPSENSKKKNKLGAF